MPFASEYGEVCGQCLKKAPPFSGVMNYGLYEGVLAEAINHLKFHGLKRLAKPLGRLLLNFDLSGIDGIVPVPLNIKRMRERGFNQSLLIARVISNKTKDPSFDKYPPEEKGDTSTDRFVCKRKTLKPQECLRGKGGYQRPQTPPCG